jgi:uncharacterized protein
MTFEWDQAKNLSNQKKHGLSFDIAKEVFFDPLAFLQPDPGTHDEDRWRIIGKIKNTTVALVVFVVRGRNADTYRLISARRVTSHERKYYEEG